MVFHSYLKDSEVYLDCVFYLPANSFEYNNIAIRKKLDELINIVQYKVNLIILLNTLRENNSMPSNLQLESV